jgi:hypothetical protein
VSARPLPLYPPESPNQRKPPAKASSPKPKVKCSPRTREDIHQAFRAGSAYCEPTGWAPIHRILYSDAMELRPGQLFMDLVFYITMTANRSRKGPEIYEAPEVEVTITDAALFCRADDRSINRMLDYMVVRNLAIVARLTTGRRPTGKALVRLVLKPETIGGKQYPGWTEEAKLPFPEWKRLHPEFDKKAEESAPDTPGSSDDPVERPMKAGTVKLTREPLTVKRGHKSRSIPINCGVRSVRMDWEAKSLDLQFSAVVDSGELVISGSLPDEQAERRTKDAKREESVASDDSRGRTGPRHPANAGIQTPTNAVSHPRAAELSQLFDPLTYRHCERTLSAEPKYLQSACENIGDTPHDFLVKAAVARGVRRLEPHHVPALCSQIQKDWKAGKDAVGSFTREEVVQKRPTFAERLTARAIERIKRDGRL